MPKHPPTRIRECAVADQGMEHNKECLTEHEVKEHQPWHSLVLSSCPSMPPHPSPEQTFTKSTAFPTNQSNLHYKYN